MILFTLVLTVFPKVVLFLPRVLAGG